MINEVSTMHHTHTHSEPNRFTFYLHGHPYACSQNAQAAALHSTSTPSGTAPCPACNRTFLSPLAYRADPLANGRSSRTYQVETPPRVARNLFSVSSNALELALSLSSRSMIALASSFTLTQPPCLPP